MTEKSKNININDRLSRAQTPTSIEPPGSDFLPDNVSVHFHFAPHSTVDHFDVAKEQIKIADIYIPELPRWTDKTLKRIRAISKGNKKIFDREMQLHDSGQFSATILELFRAIYRTYKPIILIDISKAEAGNSKPIDFYAEYVKATKDDIEETIISLSEVLRETGNRAALRDSIMVRNLGVSVTNLVNEHPKLRTKDEVKTLVTLGTNHDPVFNALWSSKHTHEQVSADTWSGGQPTYEDKVINAYRNGEMPTDVDFVSFMLSVAFTGATLDGEALYSHSEAYKRRSSNDDIPFGNQLIDAMVADDIQGCLGIAHRILKLKKQVGDERALIDEGDEVIISLYARKVKEDKPSLAEL